VVKKILKCPKCGSTEIDFLPWLGLIYRCRKCGYIGPLIIEEEIEDSS